MDPAHYIKNTEAIFACSFEDFALSERHGVAKKILIVDDQIFNIQASKAILEHRLNIPNELCDHALNGIEAFEMV